MPGDFRLQVPRPPGSWLLTVQSKLPSLYCSRCRNLAIVAGVCVVAVLVLYLLVPNLSRSRGLRGSGGQAGGPGSPPSAEWVNRVKAFFGVGVAKKIDPAQEAVKVWTVKQTGFYYCSDSTNYQNLKPGAIMTQGEALQSGYQPKLGGYCQ